MSINQSICVVQATWERKVLERRRASALQMMLLLHNAQIHCTAQHQFGVVRSDVVWCGLICSSVESVVWCGVVCYGAMWCGVLPRIVVWCGTVRCGVVCRRRCYQKAMAGMVLHAGKCKLGGLCV